MPIKSSFPKSRLSRVQYGAWLAASMLIVMAVAQLFHFEDFSTVLLGVLVTNDQREIFIISAIIVTAEVSALPFLLAMQVSKLMRMMSALLGLSVGVFWFFTALTNAHIGNVGFFGGTVSFPGGIMAVVWSALLLILVVWMLVVAAREHAKLP